MHSIDRPIHQNVPSATIKAIQMYRQSQSESVRLQSVHCVTKIWTKNKCVKHHQYVLAQILTREFLLRTKQTPSCKSNRRQERQTQRGRESGRYHTNEYHAKLEWMGTTTIWILLVNSILQIHEIIYINQNECTPSHKRMPHNRDRIAARSWFNPFVLFSLSVFLHYILFQLCFFVVLLLHFLHWTLSMRLFVS